MAGMAVELTIQADSVTALAMAQKQSAASPAINFPGSDLGHPAGKGQGGGDEARAHPRSG